MTKRIFLTARWENLVMANYKIDPGILEPYVPLGTELDYWNGNCYVSLVGFLFLNTRVRGLSIPFHRNFEEFNLRFYVRYRAFDGWRRGVVFIKEIVPKRAIAAIANTLYGEHYIALPMSNEYEATDDQIWVKYRWKFRGDWNYIEAITEPEPVPLVENSEEAFIAEHYWGYTRLNDRRTSTYQVEHPTWQVYPVRDYDIKVDVEGLYGAAFRPFLESEPDSVFMAEGSEVIVRQGEQLIKNWPHNTIT